MRTQAIDRQRHKNDRDTRAARPLILRNDKRFIGAHADYRREDYIFLRMQSPAMRALEWESRLEPIRPWAANIVANLAWDILA